MKRSELKELAAALAEQANEKPFSYWAQQDYPITWEQMHEGCAVQVEIVRLEWNNDMIHLSVAVDDGTWPSAFVPASADVIITRTGRHGVPG
jgi:hypothetical protein